ncbi:DUF502 domain-containing protein [Chloroflexota bacterium]
MTHKLKLPRPKRPSKLRQYFIAGLVVLTPLVATVLVMKWLFDFIDGIMAPLFELILGRSIPGIGFVVLVILIYLTGLMAANVFGKRIIQFIETVVERVPVFREIYKAFNQVIDSLTLSQKGAFKEVVIVEFPRAGMKTVAFVTNKFSDKHGKELLNIYIPTAPNPTSGFFQIVPTESVLKTNMSVEDAMKIVLSAGMIVPEVFDVGDYE